MINRHDDPRFENLEENNDLKYSLLDFQNDNGVIDLKKQSLAKTSLINYDKAKEGILDGI